MLFGKKNRLTREERVTVWKYSLVVLALGIFFMYVLSDTIMPYKDRLTGFLAGTGVVVALMVGEFTLIYNRRQLQTTTLFKIFELLSDPKQREYRKKLYDEFCIFYPGCKKDNREFILTDELRQISKQVEAPFSQVNILIEEELLDKELFFKMYYAVVIRSWKVLEDDINLESQRSGVPISAPFKKLASDAEEYRQRKNLPDVEIYSIPKF